MTGAWMVREDYPAPVEQNWNSQQDYFYLKNPRDTNYVLPGATEFLARGTALAGLQTTLKPKSPKLTSQAHPLTAQIIEPGKRSLCDYFLPR
jgi:hypothetical protein